MAINDQDAVDFADPRPAGMGGDQGKALATSFLGLFALSCFFPYPALAIGNSNGIQLGEALPFLALPIAFVLPPTRAFYAYLIYLIPIGISALVAMIFLGAEDPDILVKEMVSTLIAVTVITLSPWLVNRAMLPRLMVLAASAILIHVAIGAIQVYAFTKHEFPLLFLYKNPSFKSMESWAEVYATYMQRPCGLFPEPSAMSSSIGPWLILLSGILANPVCYRRLCPSRFRRWFLGAAVAGGLWLVALSRSGLAPPILAAVMVAVVVQLKYGGVKAARGLRLVGGLAAVMVGVGFAYVVWTLQAGLDARIDSSWGLRSASIMTALTANTEPLRFLFGVGPGQSSVVVRNLLAGMPIPADEAEITLWSVSVAYYADTGLLGALALACFVGLSLWSISRSSAKVLGLASMAVWWTGITITTSYSHLAAIWLFLGILFEWDRIFPSAEAGKLSPRT